MARPVSPRNQLKLLNSVTDGAAPKTSVRDAWDRQPNETFKRYKWFLLYRNMGPTRSVAKVADETKSSRAYLAHMADNYRWTARAEMWDEWLDEQFVAKMRSEQKAAVQQHFNISKAFLEKVSDALVTLDPSRLSAGQLAIWMDLAIKNQRIALGMETLAKDGSVVVNNTANTTTYNNTANVVTDATMQETLEKFGHVFRTLEETKRTESAEEDFGLGRTGRSLPAGG